jgi:hypothetical protein
MKPLRNAGVLPFEASPPAPPHVVEWGGPAIRVTNLGPVSFPLSTKWRGGQGVRLRSAGRTKGTAVREGFS